MSHWVIVHGPQLSGGPFRTPTNSWAVEATTDIEIHEGRLVITTMERIVQSPHDQSSRLVKSRRVEYAVGQWTYFEIGESA